MQELGRECSGGGGTYKVNLLQKENPFLRVIQLWCSPSPSFSLNVSPKLLIVATLDTAQEYCE